MIRGVNVFIAKGCEDSPGKRGIQMITLLGKTRQINRLLQRSENVEYDGISRVLSNVLEANVYITDEVETYVGTPSLMISTKILS